MQWVITENERTDCPGFLPEYIPDKAPKQIVFSHRNGVFIITAENVSGFFACKDGHSLKIVPKYRGIDPFVMASQVQQANLIPSGDFVKMGEGDVRIGVHSVFHSFILSLKEIADKQLKIRRKRVERRVNSIKGNVIWSRTLQNFYAHDFTVDTRIMTPTKRIPENIILAIAARKVLPFFENGSDEYNILLPWCKICQEFKPDYKTISFLSRKLHERVFSGAHAFYRKPVSIAKTILGINGVDLGESLSIQPLLFNTPLLYETFVRSLFIKTTAKTYYSCQKGFISRSFLFSSNLCEMIPDITIYRGADIKCICDVKYKKPDSKDFYQLYSYMRYTDLKEAFIITPDHEQEFEKYTTHDGYSIFFVRLDQTNSGYVSDKIKFVLERCKSYKGNSN